jgi:hypothetical protein
MPSILSSSGALSSGRLRYFARLALFLTLLHVYSGGLASAQDNWGWIEGTLRVKTTGGTIADAQIDILKSDGTVVLRTTTDAAGKFMFVANAPGEYDIRFRKAGFSEYRVRDVSVHMACGSIVDLDVDSTTPSTAVVVMWNGPLSASLSCSGIRLSRSRLDRVAAARNLWSAFETQHPSMVIEPLDEAGFHAGIIPLVATAASSWTQNGYRWDGLNITNPLEPGKPLTYAGYDDIEEVRIEDAFHSSQVAEAGAEVELISRRGSRNFHGQARAY